MRRRAIVVLRRALLLASLALVVYLLRDVRTAWGAFADAEPLPIAGAFALLLGALVWMSILWAKLVSRRNTTTARTAELVRSFARSWLARYLPGAAWAYGARLVHTDRRTASRGSVATSMLDELVLGLGATGALGGALIAWSTLGAFAGAACLVGVVVVVATVIARLSDVGRMALGTLGRRTLRRWPGIAEKVERAAKQPNLTVGAAAGFTVGYMAVSAAGGFAYVLLVEGVSSVRASDIAVLMGSYSLSVLAGMVAVFAPAGIGVREAVLTAFLAQRLDTSVAAWAAVALRVLTIVVDLVFLAGSELASALRSAHVRKEPVDASVER